MAEVFPQQPPTPPPPPSLAYAPQPLSHADERTWAMLAHLSILVNLFTGFLGPLAALIIYLVFRERSRYVAFQSMQSFILQLIAWIGGGVLAAILWTVGGILTSVFCIGLVLFPFAIAATLLPLVALGYGIYGAIETHKGKNFRYWLVAEWARGILGGTPYSQ